MLVFINFYSLFYWFAVADGIKRFFDGASNAFTVFTVILFVLYLVFTIITSVSISDGKSKTDEEDKTNYLIRPWLKLQIVTRRLFFVFIFIALFSWICYALVPTRKDAVLILAGGAVGNFITSDSSAKAIPYELTLLVREQLKSEIQEIKGSVGSTVVDTLATKTKEELIELLKQKQ